MGFVLLASLWLGVGHALLRYWIDDPDLRFRAVLASHGVFVLLGATVLHGLFRRLQHRKSQVASGERARQLLSTLAEASSDAIFAKDREGTYLLANQATARLFGQSPDTLVGAADSLIFPSDQVARIRADDVRVMNARSNLTIEEPIPTTEGLRTFLTTKGPLRDANGETFGLFGIARDITERAAVQAQLAASEQRYRLMFDANPMPMAIFHVDTLRFLDVNEAAVDHYGYSRDEFLSMTLLDIRPPGDRELVMAKVAQRRAMGDAAPLQTGRWTHQCKDGRLIQVDVFTSTALFEDKAARLALYQDVTEQVELERQRQKAQSVAESNRDLLRSVLERVDDGFVALDKDWNYTYLNPQAARLLGRDQPEDLLGQHIWTEFPDSVGQPFHRAYMRAAETQKPVVFEAHYEPWDRWFENRVYPSPQGLTIYFSDITDRKKAQRLLQDQESSFRQLAEQMPALIYRAALDGSNKTLYVSQHVRLLGFTPEQWLADHSAWDRAVHPDDLARVVAARPSATSVFAEARIEYRMRDGLGNWRHFQDNSRRVVPEAGGAPYLQGVLVDITDLMEAEQAIKASEARLRQSEQRYRLAAANGMVWDWDLLDNRLNVGGAFFENLGHPPVAGIRVAEQLEALMHPEDLPRWKDAVRAFIVDRLPYEIQFRARNAQGQWRWFQTQGSGLRDSAGRVTYMAGTTVDITERIETAEALKQSEARLRASEQRYRLAATHGSVWDWDIESGRLEIGADFWRMLGHEPVTSLDSASRIAELMHPEDRPIWQDLVRSHLLKRHRYDFEFRVRGGAGEWRWLHTQGQAVWDETGRATYMAGTTVEITARKQAQTALEASEAYRRKLFEQLSDGVLLVGPEHRILDANPQAGTMLGLTREVLLNTSLGDLLAEQELGRIERLAMGPSDLTEWAFVRGDGQAIPVEVSTRLLDGSRFLAVLRDISQRRQAENALLTYQLELSELTHQLLVQEKQTSQRIAQALHDRVGQTLAVTRLHLDALMTTVQNQIPSVLESQCLGMDRLIEQAVQEVRHVLRELRPPLLEESGLVAALDNEIASPAWELGGADLLLEVDDALLESHWPADVEYGAFMVAREAITNALQHGRPSLIRVVLEGGAGELRLDVIDDGLGIPAAMVAGRPGHLGVVGMRERAIAVGARFAVMPVEAGGTQVSLHWEALRT